MGLCRNAGCRLGKCLLCHYKVTNGFGKRKLRFMNGGFEATNGGMQLTDGGAFVSHRHQLSNQQPLSASYRQRSNGCYRSLAQHSQKQIGVQYRQKDSYFSTCRTYPQNPALYASSPPACRTILLSRCVCSNFCEQVWQQCSTPAHQAAAQQHQAIIANARSARYVRRPHL